EGYTVVGFDKAGPPYPPKDAQWLFADLTTDQGVKDAFATLAEKFGKELVSFIHLAAYYSFSGEPSNLYKDLTVDGTRRCLEALQEFNCEQFVFSSTMLVHAPSEPGVRINENSPLLPKWEYPKSKVDTENVIHELHGKVPALILRIAGVYDEWCHSIPISHQIQRIYEEDIKGHLFPGDAKHGQSFVHLEDLCDCFVEAVDRRKQLQDDCTLLIGEPITYSYESLQKLIGSELKGKNYLTEYVPKTIAKVGAWVEGKIQGSREFIKPWMIDLADDHYELDVSMARRVLGWDPKHDLYATVPLMLNNLKKDPAKFYGVNKLAPPQWLKTQMNYQHQTAAPK
ncbi:MAG TPA: NAD(P)-dependent oxidoreductase, partial [Chroococcales cyanobacterium]